MSERMTAAVTQRLVTSKDLREGELNGNETLMMMVLGVEPTRTKESTSRDLSRGFRLQSLQLWFQVQLRAPTTSM